MKVSACTSGSIILCSLRHSSVEICVSYRYTTQIPISHFGEGVVLIPIGISVFIRPLQCFVFSYFLCFRFGVYPVWGFFWSEGAALWQWFVAMAPLFPLLSEV